MVVLTMGILIGVFSMFFLFAGLVSYSQDLAMLTTAPVVALLKDVMGPVAAGFGGALAGAYGAYFLQKNSETDKQLREDASAVYKAQMQFMQKINDLISIKKNNIFPYKDSKLRFLEIPALPEIAGVPDRVSDRLIDVLIAKKNSDIVNDIFLADARYYACFANFSNRSQMLFRYRELLENSKYGKQRELSLE
jgi:hypothetical protein